MSRFMISCGGTGGHLSPGIALAEGLQARGHEVLVLISQKRVDARLVDKYPQFEFIRMPGTPFSWKPLGLLRFILSQGRGFIRCLRLIRRRHPDVVVAFGGFTSAGATLGGWILNVPVMLHESNRVPGLAIRILGGLASRIYLPVGVSLSRARARHIRHAGMPVRREIQRLPRNEARLALGLRVDRKVLVVFGGSQGSSPLNDWVRASWPALAAEGVQVYCVTGLGKGERESVKAGPKGEGRVRVVYIPFCDDVATLLSAADLVLSRAGAGTIAELIRCETPAILVPYPWAADNHQQVNAGFFEKQGGGLVVSEEDLPHLRDEVLETLFNDWLLERFRWNLQRMDRADPLSEMLADLEAIADKAHEPRRSRKGVLAA